MSGVATNSSCRPLAPPTVVRTLVISQHEAVRRELVMYLGRSPGILATGAGFSEQVIVQAQADVLVLDLSGISKDGLELALRTARRTGARVVALASLQEATDERAVLAEGGVYALKSAGAGGLSEKILELAQRPG